MEVTTAEMTDYICRCILRHCGGHLFPALAIIEGYFTTEGLGDFMKCEIEFLQHFYGPAFEETKFYPIVLSRCFDAFEQIDLLETAHRVLSGTDSSVTDIETLIRVGWWNEDTDGFISTLIFNICLAKKKLTLRNVEIKKLTTEKSPEENAEEVIIAGFRSMEKVDFYCLIDIYKVPVENSLSYSWALKAKSSFSNVFLRSQERSIGTGLVDFYLNGYADTAIEFIRDATIVKSGGPRSTDIDEHLGRFLNKEYYHWNRFLIVNLAMKGDKLILPQNSAYHKNVFTYVHETNTLYRGSTAIVRPAVHSLECSGTLSALVEMDKKKESRVKKA